ncbi:MAG: GGDEF domain-containing protein [Sandaracinaceae bacterium]
MPWKRSKEAMLEQDIITVLTRLALADSPLEVERNRRRASHLVGDNAVGMRQLVDALAEASMRVHELSRLATEDALTGLANRRSFGRALTRELARRRRVAGPAVLLLDLDGLKQINDTYGHAAGDEAIQRAANACACSIRGGDLAARLGGDELAILLPDTGLAGAERVANRVCEAIERERVRNQPLRVSLGIAVAGPDGDDEGAVLAAADNRMYEQKRRRKVKMAA